MPPRIPTAASLDAQDELGAYRRQFHIPVHASGKDAVYFVGNSLGLQPKTTRAHVEEVLDDWARYGVEGHFRPRHPWMPYHELITEPMAHVVGALPSEVVVMNTLTANLHLMMVSFYRPEGARFKILMEANAFPSDHYAIASQVRFHGYDPDEAILAVKPRAGEHTLRTEDLTALLETQGNDIALVLLGGVNYQTGQWFEMEPITRIAQAQGCTVGFDLAHAAGNVPVHLHDWHIDFAVWCTYKYLNGGPGNLGGCFVHERHANRADLPRFAGWWGHNKATRFLMPDTFDPIPGAEGWQLSNPPILPLAALRASLAQFEQAGMARLRAKSERLTGYFEQSIHHTFSDDTVQIVTPSDPTQRGCQLSLRLPGRGKAVFEALHQHGIFCDWREPDIIRVAPVPLYNRFSDVELFINVLNALVNAPTD